VDTRPYRRIHLSSAKRWSDSDQKQMKQNAIIRYMNQVQLYAETFAAINEEPAASEVRRLRSEYHKCYHAVFEENIQRRMSLALSQETARFSIFVPEVFLYPLLSRMNILHTEYRYCHIGSLLLPRFSLHVKYFLHRREDVEIVLGHQAIATRWWRGAEHQRPSDVRTTTTQQLDLSVAEMLRFCVLKTSP